MSEERISSPSAPSRAVPAAGSGGRGGDSSHNKPREYNPRWRGYTLICITSLITLSSVSTTAVNTKFQGHPGMAVAWGVITFALSLAIIVLDRFQCLAERFNYTKAMNGRLEGYTLLGMFVFWIVGVALITQVNGVGYLTLNTYFGSWLTLFSCVYTLNAWSAAKDILSIDELTGVSATLKSWYVVFLSSLVVTGTAINYMVYVAASGYGYQQQPDAAVCVALGCVSTVVALSWICVHYNFISVVSQGGWLEVLVAVGVVLCWIVMVALATGEGGIGSTIVGTMCGASVVDLMSEQLQSASDNCTVVLIQGNSTTEITCSAVTADDVPGSNLYVFTWIGLVYSLNVCFRWKAQQALLFAQTQHDRMHQGEARIPDRAGEDEEEDEEDDLQDFEGAKNH